MNPTRSTDPLRVAQADPLLFELAEKLAEFGVIETVTGPPRVCRWSEGLCRLVGVDRLAPVADVPEFVARFVSADDRDRVLHHLTGDPTAASTGPAAYWIHRVDGAMRRVRSQLRRERDAVGHALREIIIVQDLTGTRDGRDLQGLVPDRLLQVSRLSAVGEMASGMAHEINQPLAAIATFAQALSRLIRDKRGDPGEILEAVDQIAAQALRAGAIVNQIREFSQHARTHLEPTDVNAVIREFAILAQSIAQPHTIAIQTELGTLNGRVRADAIQLQQLLLLLFANAVDAIAETNPRQRNVRLTTRLVDGQAIEVSVEDTGGGIRPDILPRLYDAFVSSKPLGTGLGLLTCRRIVHAHGGNLGVENRPGHGARFYFTLPTGSARVHRRASKASRSPDA